MISTSPMTATPTIPHPSASESGGTAGPTLRPCQVDVPEVELTRDEVLDNITVYSLTDTGASASRRYCEGAAPHLRGGTAPGLPVAAVTGGW